MKISIIVPAHNEEDVIQDCLDALLNEEYEPKEIIVVNDGSTDRTREIVESYGDKVKSINFDRGHSAAFARNRGAQLATGDVLVFVDADQIIASGFLRRIEEGFKKYPINLMGVNVKTKKGNKLVSRCYEIQRAEMEQKVQKNKGVFESTNNLPSYAFIFNRDLFQKLTGFDESIFYFEDGDITERAFEIGAKMLFNPDVLVYHIEPSTWKGVFRQGIYKGKGTLKLYALKKTSVFWLLPQFFYIGFIISIVLIPIIWYLCIPFLSYLLYVFVIELRYTKNPVMAFIMTFVFRTVIGVGQAYGVITELKGEGGGFDDLSSMCI